MSTIRLVRRYIFALPPAQVFVTRELLAYGERADIDWLMSYMVAKKMILRLARGVFVRNDEGLTLPSLEKIVEAKARAFGKLLIPSAEKLTDERGLEKPHKPDGRMRPNAASPAIAEFSTIGCKGNFWTHYGRVEFKSIAPRKFFIAQEKVGKCILAMWHAGDDALYCPDALQRREKFTRIDKKRVKELAAWSPTWLQFYLHADPPDASIHAPWSLLPPLNKYPEPTSDDPKVKESSTIYTSEKRRLSFQCTDRLLAERTNFYTCSHCLPFSLARAG